MSAESECMTRRAVITLSFAGLFTLSSKLPAMTRIAMTANAFHGTYSPGKPVHWEALMEQISRLASRENEDRDYETYVREVEALFQRSSVSQIVNPIAKQFAPNSPPAFYPRLVNLERKELFEVKLVLFNRGEQFPLHDHPNMSGVMHCATGSVNVDNFEPVAVPMRRKEDCLLRHVSQTMMTPGSTNTLTANRANIHQLRAQASSQIIDIFTPPYDPGRLSSTHYYQIEDKLPNQVGSIVRAQSIH